MSEKKKVRQRKCRICDFYFDFTAEGIKQHAQDCERKQREKHEKRTQS